MQLSILLCQVLAYANELISVGLRGLDELGHPTAGTFSIIQMNEVSIIIFLHVPTYVQED